MDELMSIFSIKRSAAVFGMAVVLSVTMHGQSVQGTEARPGKLVGTVTDVNDDPVPDATVVLDTESDDPRTLVTPENGFFEFNDVKPGTSYQINITAKGFADWTSPAITLEPGQFKIVTVFRVMASS
jgi:Carboxypeptidase regulatory-like domain